METAIRPGIYDPLLADEDVRVSTERSHELTRRLAQEEGILAGVSSGAALAACLDLAGADPRRRDRHGVSRQRHALSDRALLGRAGLMSADGWNRRTTITAEALEVDPALTASRPFRTSAAARSSRSAA